MHTLPPFLPLSLIHTLTYTPTHTQARASNVQARVNIHITTQNNGYMLSLHIFLSEGAGHQSSTVKGLSGPRLDLTKGPDALSTHC